MQVHGSLTRKQNSTGGLWYSHHQRRCHIQKFDDKVTRKKYYIELTDGTRSNNVTLKRRDVEIIIMHATGMYANATRKNAS